MTTLVKLIIKAVHQFTWQPYDSSKALDRKKECWKIEQDLEAYFNVQASFQFLLDETSKGASEVLTSESKRTSKHSLNSAFCEIGTYKVEKEKDSVDTYRLHVKRDTILCKRGPFQIKLSFFQIKSNLFHNEIETLRDR